MNAEQLRRVVKIQVFLATGREGPVTDSVVEAICKAALPFVDDEKDGKESAITENQARALIAEIRGELREALAYARGAAT